MAGSMALPGVYIPGLMPSCVAEAAPQPFLRREPERVTVPARRHDGERALGYFEKNRERYRSMFGDGVYILICGTQVMSVHVDLAHAAGEAQRLYSDTGCLIRRIGPSSEPLDMTGMF